MIIKPKESNRSRSCTRLLNLLVLFLLLASYLSFHSNLLEEEEEHN